MESNDREGLANRLLDAALKHYSNAEPRAGLEARVLANLRAESDQLGTRRGLWLAIAAMAVVGVVAATTFLIRRPAVEPQVVATRAVAGVIAKKATTLPTELKTGSVHRRSHVFLRRGQRVMFSAATLADDGPKLEQFPSPRPLSEQEEMLARYVQERPQEARLVAHAQAELSQQDLLEFEKRNELPEASNSTQ